MTLAKTCMRVLLHDELRVWVQPTVIDLHITPLDEQNTYALPRVSKVNPVSVWGTAEHFPVLPDPYTTTKVDGLQYRLPNTLVNAGQQFPGIPESLQPEFDRLWNVLPNC